MATGVRLSPVVAPVLALLIAACVTTAPSAEQDAYCRDHFGRVKAAWIRLNPAPSPAVRTTAESVEDVAKRLYLIEGLEEGSQDWVRACLRAWADRPAPVGSTLGGPSPVPTTARASRGAGGGS